MVQVDVFGKQEQNKTQVITYIIQLTMGNRNVNLYILYKRYQKWLVTISGHKQFILQHLALLHGQKIHSTSWNTLQKHK